MNAQPPQLPPQRYPYQQPRQGFPLPPMTQFEQWQIQGEFAKSYTTPAIITLVLYIILWIPGLIANIVYLIEANKTKQVTGRTPAGYGCLIAMLCFVALPPALFVLIIAFLTLISALVASAPH